MSEQRPGGVPEPVHRTHLVALFGPFLGDATREGSCVNIGCGRNLEPGFTNYDRRPARDLGVKKWDLEAACPLPSNSVDCILASHVMEHVKDLIHAMREIHRVLKVGGHLIAVTPYASSDDAVEDPTHVRYFTERSWHYFDQRLYAQDGHTGSYQSDIDYSFDVVKIDLIPYPDLTQSSGVPIIGHEADIQVRKRFLRNVIRECHAVLRKV